MDALKSIAIQTMVQSDHLATIEPMIAVVWHFWLGLILLIAGVGAIVNVIVGYVTKVSSLKYPNRRQRNAQK